MKDYYTYAYLREDLSPYYIGKGRGNRMFNNHIYHKKPKDSSRIAILRKNMTEEQAFKHESEIIKFFGRKDIGTGLLRNMTEGGGGTSGHKMSNESKAKMSVAKRNMSKEIRAKISLSKLGKKHTEEHKVRIGLGQRGRILSEQHKKDISLKMMGNTNASRAKL